MTELESTGFQAVSAQSIATGKSAELAREEQARALYRHQCAFHGRPSLPFAVERDSKIRRWSCMCAAVVTCSPSLASPWSEGYFRPYGWGWPNAWRLILPARGWSLLVAWHAGRYGKPPRSDCRKRQTAAVFGTGVDVIYPKENWRLSEQILAFGGALISEFPLGTFAAPQNFPIRNRILSGMSVGVLVVEAAEDSGTRITARLALEKIATSMRCPAT